MPSDSGRITPNKDISTEGNPLKRKAPSDSMHKGFRKEAYKFKTSSDHEDSEPEYKPEPATPRRKQPTAAADSLGAAVTAPKDKEVKKRRQKVEGRARELTEPSKPFMSNEEIKSKAKDLSQILKNIPEHLIYSNNHNVLKRTVTSMLGTQRKNLRNLSKDSPDVALAREKVSISAQLDKQVANLESYRFKPDAHISPSDREGMSRTLIDIHRLIADSGSSAAALRNLYNHIDGELKKRFPQTSDNPPSESGFSTEAADTPFYETPYRPS